MKSTFYFDHDYNSRNDLKILELRSEYGWEGYGLFWAIIETLCEQNGHIKREALGGLSLGLSMDKAKLIQIIDFCINIELLYENGNGISNARSLEHLAFRKSLSDYGKKGGRPKKKEDEKPPESPPLAPPKPVKESKVNKMYARKQKILSYVPINEEEIKTQNWLNEKYPRVQRLELPLIATELLDKVKEHGKDKVVKTLSEMENKKDLLTKYIDAGRTLENWLTDIK